MRVGLVIKTLRQRKRWRQEDLAQLAHVSRQLVARIEAGRLDRVGVVRLRRVAAAVGAQVEYTVRWPGEDLDRLLNARHAAMHEAIARLFRELDEWMATPEVSFSIYGERGVIDIVAWNPTRRALLIIELKTALVDVNDLMGTMDRRRRLARRISADRGWDPRTVSVWVVLADTPTNRRRLAAHATVLRAAFPADGRTMRGWLRDPTRAVSALSFLSNATVGSVSRASDRRARVRRLGSSVTGVGTRATRDESGP
jgi:transcriptional regulator with XRE-family HTH domain